MRKVSLVVAMVATVILAGGTAQADSPVVTASGNQCEATWLSSPDQFRIRDNDTDDSDYCFVDWGWSSGALNSRFANPQDAGGYFYHSVNTTGKANIWWKVCKERQADPDICSTTRQDAT